VSTQKIGRWYQVDQREIPGIGRREVAEIGPPPFKTKSFQMVAWDPTEKTKGAFKAEIRRNLGRFLEAYCADVEHQIQDFKTWSNEANGLRPHYQRAPEIRQEKHFSWLVAYQLHGASLNFIAEAVEVDRHAVQLGVERLAAEIGLTLRPKRDYRVIKPAVLRKLLGKSRQ